MTGKQTPNRKGVRLYPPPSKDFDPFAATKKDLMRHGLPLRPDPQTQPGMAALWERQAARYRNFEHLEARPDTTTADKKAVTAPALGLDPSVNCGYQLFSSSAPFTVLSIIWTVPDLQFVPGPPADHDYFHTWVSLGFLNVHVEMTVDSAQNVTSQIWAQSVGQVNLPVRPGDVMGASLCLDTKPPGTAHYFFTNETTLQTINFTVDTGFPSCRHHQCRRHSRVRPDPILPLATGALRGRLLRQYRRLHNEWQPIADRWRRHHHGRRERQDPRQSVQGQRLHLQGRV